MTVHRPPLAQIRSLTIEQAEALRASGAVAIDIRNVDDYFDVHIPASVSLQYEFGPGMMGRARDCIPLDQDLVLLEDGRRLTNEVAAGLRGKGFAVAGVLSDALGGWGAHDGAFASTPTVTSPRPPDRFLLSVGDPGSPMYDGATFISIEEFWERAGEVPSDEPVVLIAARGVRAAMAIGMLERAGITNITVWRRG